MDDAIKVGDLVEWEGSAHEYQGRVTSRFSDESGEKLAVDRVVYRRKGARLWTSDPHTATVRRQYVTKARAKDEIGTLTGNETANDYRKILEAFGRRRAKAEARGLEDAELERRIRIVGSIIARAGGSMTKVREQARKVLEALDVERTARAEKKNRKGARAAEGAAKRAAAAEAKKAAAAERARVAEVRRKLTSTARKYSRSAVASGARPAPAPAEPVAKPLWASLATIHGYLGRVAAAEAAHEWEKAREARHLPWDGREALQAVCDAAAEYAALRNLAGWAKDHGAPVALFARWDANVWGTAPADVQAVVRAWWEVVRPNGGGGLLSDTLAARPDDVEAIRVLYEAAAEVDALRAIAEWAEANGAPEHLLETLAAARFGSHWAVSGQAPPEGHRPFRSARAVEAPAPPPAPAPKKRAAKKKADPNELPSEDTKGAARLRGKDDPVRRYLQARRPAESDVERWFNYRTEAGLAYEQAREEGAAVEVLDALAAELQRAVAFLEKHRPGFVVSMLRPDAPASVPPAPPPALPAPALPDAERAEMRAEAERREAAARRPAGYGEASQGGQIRMFNPAVALDKRALLKDIARDQRAKDRAALEALRKELKAARAARVKRLEEVKASCRAGRERAREWVREMRQAVREQTNERAAKVRGEARTICELDRGSVKRTVTDAAAALAAERQRQKEYRAIDRSASKRKVRPKATAKERAAESDDEVRQNIGPELVALFERVKRQIKGSARKSRTEAFLEYAEEHPGEVLEAIDDKTDALVRELEARQRAMGADDDFPFGALAPDAHEARANPERLEEIMARVRARDAAVRAFVAAGERRFAGVGRGGLQIAITPDLGKPGIWRVTRFDADGPIGHVEFSSYGDAVASAVRDHGLELPRANPCACSKKNPAAPGRFLVVVPETGDEEEVKRIEWAIDRANLLAYQLQTDVEVENDAGEVVYVATRYPAIMLGDPERARNPSALGRYVAGVKERAGMFDHNARELGLALATGGTTGAVQAARSGRLRHPALNRKPVTKRDRLEQTARARRHYAGQAKRLIAANPALVAPAPGAELVGLGWLTEMVYRDAGGVTRSKRWAFGSAPLLAYHACKRGCPARGKLAIVYPDGRRAGASSKKGAREYARTHWGQRGTGQNVSGVVLRVAPPALVGELLSLTYTTQKGSDRALVDYVHAMGEGGRGPYAPALVAQVGARFALAGGSYTVNERGIVG